VNRPFAPLEPTYPFDQDFYTCPWFTDLIALIALIALIFLEVLMLAAFALFLLSAAGSFLGLSYFLHSKLFIE